MSFLQHLKAQAHQLKAQQTLSKASWDENVRTTEKACQLIDWYLRDLAAQLNVIEPPCTAVTVDGRSHWPAMKRVQFRADVRKSLAAGKDWHERIGMGWQLVPVQGKPAVHVVMANFPPDLEKIERRLALGRIAHEKVGVHDPQNGRIKEFRFECVTQASGGVLMTPDHEVGQIEFLLNCLNGFEQHRLRVPAQEVDASLMDELAKAIVGHESHFLPR